ncbi:DHA2 family multidrug resistance protein [Rhizomicrobium palustre]|uniref:DHA2 family multidrug resistance protein n=1 Tax=Rhizomicrobium palustre TaxID=189966 RepID=A0A846MVF0_9PROT|nr:DHA2 family efflux MFS transporter permease subunit [Rhizomicrobium palustre]NIK87040.1 DHA2 family multidrug resistance protein [Rhizomicrobium palustre]
MSAGGKKEPSGFVLVAIVLVLAMANFLAILDITIVNVLVPQIAGGLAVSSADGTWVITAYAVAEAIMVPLTGWLAERFGPVRVFVTGIFGFGIVSVLCGLATSLPMLIVFRILLGMCGGPLIPLSQTLLLKVVPQKHEVAALAVWSMTTILAPVAGPALGGIIADQWSWPWAFHFKLPLALPLAALAWYVLKDHEMPTMKSRVDFVGLGLLVLWVGALQIMLGNGQNMDWFNSDFIVALLVTTILGFIAFVIWEMTDTNPIVNLRVFANRSFSVSMVVIALAYGAMFGAVVLVPLWLQNIQGYTATLAGYNTAFAGIFSVILAPITTKLMTKFDHRLLIMVGLLFCAGSSLMRIFFNGEMTFEMLLWPQVLQGLSFPLIIIPLMDMSVSSLPPKDTAAGAGQFNFIRTLSGAIATAVVVAAWENAIKWNKAVLVSRVRHGQDMMAALQAGGFTEQKARSLFDLGVLQQAAQLGTNQTFLAIGVVLLFTAAAVWIAPKPPRHANGKPPVGH